MSCPIAPDAGRRLAPPSTRSHPVVSTTSRHEPRPVAAVDLRARRAELRLAPQQVAAQVGVHANTVLRWERGERLPGPEAVGALARVLEADRADIVGFFDQHRSPAEPAQRVRATGLRTLRHRRDWPAAHVADHLGVPVSTVFNWESGRVGLPVDLLPRLAELLARGGRAPAVADVRQLLGRSVPRQVPATSRRGPLWRARRGRGWSQQRLADQLGVSRQLVGSWERGRVPGLVHQRRLAAVLGEQVSTVAGWYATAAPLGLRPGTWRPGDLGQVLRDLRAWSGLRQRDVARHCGRSVAAVRTWESGRCVPSSEQRDLLVALYRLPARALDAAGHEPARARPRPTGTTGAIQEDPR